MKRLFKWGVRLAVVLVFVLAILVLFRNSIGKAALEREIRNETGLDVTIGRITIGLSSPTVTIQNLTLMNTSNFDGSRFLDVPDVRVEYDPAGFLSGKIHLKLLRFNLSEVHIIQNKEGKTNLQTVRERQKQRKSTRSSGESNAQFESIDTLILSLGRFKYTSHKTPANDQEIWIGARNETAKDVKSARDLEPLIAKIALEKGAKILADAFRSPDDNALHDAKRSVKNKGRNIVEGPAEAIKSE